MPTPYGTFCDDFYVNMRLGTQMALPNARETLLHFFEQAQKAFPGMTRFRRGGDGEFSIEEDRSTPMYRWLSVEPTRLSAGHVNPEEIEDAAALHKMVLGQAPYALGISPVEIDYMDVLFGFDLEFTGNHDEVVASALLGDAPMTCLFDAGAGKPLDFQPKTTIALTEDCRLQARLEIVTRTGSYEVRTGDFDEDVISVYLVIRQYWGNRTEGATPELFDELLQTADELASDRIVPQVLQPLGALISSKS
ncbi:MAG: hypothetical protein AAF656_05060 [Planctomycetota bacterium]